MIETWFNEGVDDPHITVIKVVPSEGYYWDTKYGNAVAGLKMIIGTLRPARLWMIPLKGAACVSRVHLALSQTDSTARSVSAQGL